MMAVVMMLPFSVLFFILFSFLWRPPPHSRPLGLRRPTGWDSERVQTQSNSQQRSVFSLRMPPSPRHKSPSIHIFQLGAGFCPGRARCLERAAIRPAPPGVRGQGQLNVWPLHPFDGCSPAMSQSPPPRSPPCPEHTIIMGHIKRHSAPLRETEMAAKRKMICDHWPFPTVQSAALDRCTSCYGVSQCFECARHVYKSGILLFCCKSFVKVGRGR